MAEYITFADLAIGVGLYIILTAMVGGILGFSIGLYVGGNKDE